MNLINYAIPHVLNPWAVKDTDQAKNATPIDEITITPVEDIKVEKGSRRPMVDFIRNVLSLPTQLIYGDMGYNAGASDEDIAEARQFLAEKDLKNVAISANRYAPREVWGRIFSNPKTSLLSKCTMGIASGLFYTLSVSRLSGISGDYYSPAENTVHLFSNSKARAVLSCASAEKHNKIQNPVLYSLANTILPNVLMNRPVARELTKSWLNLDRVESAHRHFRESGDVTECNNVLYTLISSVVVKIFSPGESFILPKGGYMELGKSILLANLAQQTLSYIGKCIFTNKSQNLTETLRQKFQVVRTGILHGFVGVPIAFVTVITLTYVLKYLGLENVGKNSAAMKNYSKIVDSSFFDTAIMAPFLEELMFRVCLQDIMGSIFRKILPDRDVKLPFMEKIKLTALASIATASVLFGLMHLGNKTGLEQPINCMIGGFAYGLIYNKYGLFANFLAHATNNGIAFSLSKLLQT